MNLLISSNQILALATGSFELPPANPWTLQRIMDEILTPLANFLIMAGIVLAVITLVVSGIMYFKPKSEKEAEKGKDWFKRGLIGALIILGVGVIINTVSVVVTGEFFNFLPGGKDGEDKPLGGQPGDPCKKSGSACFIPDIGTLGTYCVSGICTRATFRNGQLVSIDGNEKGEKCKVTLNCKSRICNNGRCE